MSFQGIITVLKGGSGSGNFGHAGRPGKIGGSDAKVGLPAVTLNRIANGDVTGFLMRDERYDYFVSKGFDKADVDWMENVLNSYGYGGDNQMNAQKTILNEIRDNTAKGQLLKEQIKLETAIAKEIVAQIPHRIEKELKAAVEDFDFYGEGQIMGGYYSKEDRSMYLKDLKNILESEVGYLYRKGKLDKPIQSWTSNAKGADMGKGSYIGIDHTMSMADMFDKYKVLGGFSKLMGAPGEAEVTLIDSRFVP